MANPLLTRKSVILAKIESERGVDASPAGVDAILVEDPDVSVDTEMLERNFTRPSLSPLPIVMGRKLVTVTFGVELKSNNRTNSGLVADAARIGRFLRACGYAEVSVLAAGGGGAVYPAAANVGIPVAWTTGGTGVRSQPTRYTIAVTTGGASGTAQVSVTPDAQAIEDTVDAAVAPAAITSGTPVALGASGITVTPTWAGTLVVGDKWHVWVYPQCVAYRPASANFDTITLHVFFDGLLHKVTGCLGTFELSAEAGQYGKLNFTFTGQWNDPEDSALPNPIYEQGLPPVFELSKLRLDGYAAVIQSLTYSQNNQIVPRSDSRASEGYDGLRLTGRSPEGGIDPEAALVASYDFWNKMATSQELHLKTRFGRTAGNTIWMIGHCQYTGLTYQSREDIRVLDAGLRFIEQNGDDEVELLFT